MAKRATRTGRRPQQSKHGGAAMIFGRTNYVLLLIGMAAVLVGYVIMQVDSQVDGFLSLYVAPLIILGGYLEIIYAILWKPKAQESA